MPIQGCQMVINEFRIILRDDVSKCILIVRSCAFHIYTWKILPSSHLYQFRQDLEHYLKFPRTGTIHSFYPVDTHPGRNTLPTTSPHLVNIKLQNVIYFIKEGIVMRDERPQTWYHYGCPIYNPSGSCQSHAVQSPCPAVSYRVAPPCCQLYTHPILLSVIYTLTLPSCQ